VKRIYLQPVAGRASPDPDNGNTLLPEAGAWVMHTAYWQRRLADGDVTEAEPPVENPPVVEAVDVVPAKGSKAS
jgi:hypothetical protein